MSLVQVVKFHPVNETQGYVVYKKGTKYQVAFASRFVSEDKTIVYKKEADSRSLGRLLEYSSPFTADYVIRKEILPLYEKVA